MEFETRKYVIIDVSDLKYIDFNQVLETSPETCTYSIDGTKTFVKYEGEQPSCISSLENKSKEYNIQEIMSILQTPEWLAVGD